ncbi:hypothetical protein ACVIJ6_001013 [Bradyrhizobium sp. USDA 4369]
MRIVIRGATKPKLGDSLLKVLFIVRLAPTNEARHGSCEFFVTRLIAP